MTTKRANVLTLGLLVLVLATAPAIGDETIRGMQRSDGHGTGDLAGGGPLPGNLMLVASANGMRQVPAVLTPGRAWFRARILPEGPFVEWELRYQLEGPIKEAFLHIGQTGANGAKAVALCVEEPPGGVPGGADPCPAGNTDVITGLIMPEDLLPSAAAQGVDELNELVAAMLARITYLNVYSHFYPQNGEVRGQIAPLRAGNPGGGGGPLNGGPGGAGVDPW